MEIQRGTVQTAAPTRSATESLAPPREDLSSLSWCAGEIHQSLDQVEQTLGKALEGGGDLSQVSAARAVLHQVHGALVMLALPGPLQLATEAETLLDKVQAGDMAFDAEMSSALAGAFNAINEYLQELLRGMPQQPLYLFPFLRDLMALRKADRIHPADLFFPRLDVAAPEALALQPIDDEARKRVRGRFEAGLLRTLRTPQDRQSAGEMLAAVEIVEHSELAATNPLFWSVLPVFFRALISGEADLDVHGKRLLARLNMQLRRTLADGSPVSERLLRDTLFSIACARPQTESLKSVFAQFDLAGRVPADVDSPRYGQVDKRAMRDVAAAVAEMKKSWETMLQSPGGVSAHLGEFKQGLSHFQDAAEALDPDGLGRLTGAWIGVVKNLGLDSGPVSEQIGVEVATSLLFVEQLLEGGFTELAQRDQRCAEIARRIDACLHDVSVDDEAPGWLLELSATVQERLTMAAFVSETQASLRESEAALDAWFRDAGQGRDGLPEAAARFAQVSGVLALLAHDDAADAARHLAAVVRDLHEGVQLDEVAATRLADTVGMLGFFVEAMVANAGILADFHFDPTSGVLARRSGDAAIPSRALVSGPATDAVAAPAVESLEVRLDALLARVDGLLRDTMAEAVPADLDRQLDATLVQVADLAQLADAGDLVVAARDARRVLNDAGLSAALQMATTLGRSTTGLAAAPVAAPLPEAASQVDAELLEIFLAEAAEVLEAIEQAHLSLGAQSADQASLVALRRGFHTLKGSSRMVGLDVFGDAGWSIEQLLNFWMADEKPATPQMLALIDDARRFFHDWVEALNAQGTSQADRDFSALSRRADALRTGRPIDDIVAAPRLETTTLAPRAPGAAIAADGSAGHDADDPMAALAAHAADSAAPGLTLDPTVMGFAEAGNEAYSLDLPPLLPDDTAIGAIGASAGDQGDEGESIEMSLPAEEVTLAGLDLEGFEPDSTGESAPPMFATDDPIVDLHEADEAAGPAVTASEVALDETDIVTVDGRRISHSLFRVFAAEVDDLQAGLLQDAREWQQHPQRRASEMALRTVHSLKGSAALVGAEAARALAEQVERFLAAQSVNGRPASAEDLGHYGMLVQTLMGALKQYARHEPVASIDEVLASATQLANRWQSGHTDVAGQSVAPVAIIAQGTGTDAPTLSDEIDHELLPLFVEEASEYLPQIGDNLQSWLSRPDDVKLQQLVMRQLHTVKGSARMAGAMVLGQRVHEMETRVEAAMKGASVSVDLIESLMAEHDLVIEQFEQLLGLDDAPPAKDAGDMAPTGPVAGPAPAQPAVARGAQADAEASAQLAPEGAARIEATRSTGQALVRVRADLLDKLVNEAGEVSIARSRLDNAVSSVRLSMGELAENVNRLRKHLREIEMHAETRIQSNRDPAPRAPEGADFDPLEFDRFTRFQELARMLAEAVNDVSTVHLNSSRNLEDAVQDLSRQGQTLRQLQHDLLSVRMVQFGTINDRLYRVVRQSAKMLGKRVSLDIRGHTVHTDRGVLERMVAPMEHLLRNAVSHGIESPEERVAAGKSETGEIVIGVQQSGNEIVISMHDDGGGLNMARIRARAIERGLLEPDAMVSEDALADLIFRPGFSTAQAVDQISGRGVGMDVVRSEVASLGGRIEVMSEAGRGLRYQIHLPITMALAQVMMVSAGALRYAVSASSVEKLLHLSPEELASAYSRRAIEVDGKSIPLFYLSTLVNEPDQKPSAQHLSPVILVRTGNGRIAVHADEVGKSQEVVVKNVGPQVSRVGGVAGATVLGNGEIVLILNLGQLSRGVSDKLQDAAMKAGVAASLADAPVTVMVVDDSVTVRKVTQRLLVREGFDVVLAKDGVDALRQLQERRPDAMLVDIEMPRMDGFDLTRSLRKDERFAGLPIIMITSRTADKHRNFALSLGVNEFLGKPYGEAELVSLLRAYTARTEQPQA